MNDQPTVSDQITEADPTHCDKCASPLTYGWSSTYQEGGRVRSICFDCDKREHRDDYKKTGILTTKVIMDATLTKTRMAYRDEVAILMNRADLLMLIEVNTAYERIRDAIRIFEREVWYAGLQAKVKAASFRGFRANFTADMGGETKAVRVLCWSCAARTMLTIEYEEDSAQVSVITADDETGPVMGMQSISATIDQALDLLNQASAHLKGGKAFRTCLSYLPDAQ